MYPVEAVFQLFDAGCVIANVPVPLVPHEIATSTVPVSALVTDVSAAAVVALVSAATLVADEDAAEREW